MDMQRIVSIVRTKVKLHSLSSRNVFVALFFFVNITEIVCARNIPCRAVRRESLQSKKNYVRKPSVARFPPRGIVEQAKRQPQAANRPAAPVPAYSNPNNTLATAQIQPNKISQQIYAIRAERQRLEACKHALLNEFAKKQAAFLSKITEQDESKDHHALLLAVSSKSLDDFVHGAIMLNYIKYYLANKNTEFSNFIKNIQRVNYCIQYYTKMEAELISKGSFQK
jgi:hypothetical protein